MKHVCTFPKLTLPSWEGRRFYCMCGAVHEYRGGKYVLVVAPRREAS